MGKEAKKRDANIKHPLRALENDIGDVSRLANAPAQYHNHPLPVSTPCLPAAMQNFVKEGSIIVMAVKSMIESLSWGSGIDQRAVRASEEVSTQIARAIDTFIQERG